MHGLGNDFMMIDAVNQNIALDKKTITALSNRHTGIGFDQCLLIEPSTRPDVDFCYRIFNADGGEVGQCGNGARALALFARRQGLTKKSRLTVATKTTTMQLQIHEDDQVSVNMGVPKWEACDIPLTNDYQSATLNLDFGEQGSCLAHCVNVGNPHAVLTVDELSVAPVATLGPKISTFAGFTEGANAGFMQIVNDSHIKLRVYERGSGETSACGSGAAAACAIGRLYHNLQETVTVSLTGGDLTIHWPTINSSLLLTGPAAFVYEGVINI